MPSIFSHNNIPVDGLNLQDAIVKNNVFSYSGGPVPTFKNCTLEDNQFAFHGPALNTLTLLRLIASLYPKDKRPTLGEFLGLDIHESLTVAVPDTKSDTDNEQSE